MSGNDTYEAWSRLVALSDGSDVAAHILIESMENADDDYAPHTVDWYRIVSLTFAFLADERGYSY